jgi:Cu+-exporting ATPase
MNILSLLKSKKIPPTATHVSLHLSDLHCAACAVTIDTVLEEIPGVFKVNTSYGHSKVEIFFDEEKTSTQELIQVIAKAGYTASQTD